MIRPIERPLARKTVTLEDRRIHTFRACRRARRSNPCRQLAIHMKTDRANHLSERSLRPLPPRRGLGLA
jgi:hypothetical protein